MFEALRIVAFREGKNWVAQCLERDVCVQAPTLKDLQARMNVTLAAEAGDGTLDRLPAAPDRFFKRWDERSDMGVRETIDGHPYQLALCA